MTPSGGLTSLMVILGPILIVVAIVWAIMRNRKTSRADLERTERATHDMYKAQDAQDKGDDTAN